MIYVVLGMHKSGTTLVSQMLHHSGINMGEFDEGVSYDKGNKYERESTFELDKEILGAKDDEVLNLPPPRVEEIPEEQKGRMRDIVQRCEAKHSDWGFKDPRATLIYDFWARELPPHKIIAMYRPADQIWPRFKWKGRRKYHTNFQRAYTFLCRWQEHNRAIVRSLRETSLEFILLDYEALMTDETEFERLNTFVGGQMDDRRVPGLFRARSGSDFFLETAERLVQWRRGWFVQDTLEELETLRRG